MLQSHVIMRSTGKLKLYRNHVRRNVPFLRVSPKAMCSRYASAVDFRKGGVEISKNAVRGGSSNRKGGVAKSWMLVQNNSGGLLKAARRSIKHVKRCYFAYKKVDISENFPLAPSALATPLTTYLGWKRAKNKCFCVRGFGRVSTSRWNS